MNLTSISCTVVSNDYTENGKKLRNFFIREFPVESIGKCNRAGICYNHYGNFYNSYSKYPLYCIFLYSQWEITVMTLGKNFSAIICYKHQQCAYLKSASFLYNALNISLANDNCSSALQKMVYSNCRLFWSPESSFLWYKMRPIVRMVVNRLINTEMGWLSKESSNVQ